MPVIVARFARGTPYRVPIGHSSGMACGLIASLTVACTAPGPRDEVHLTLGFGGDIMLNQIPVRSRPFSGARRVLGKPDVMFANLEVPLTDSTNRTTRKTAAEIARRDQYVLRADPGHWADFRASGIDAVSMANNHTMDYGPQGLSDMLSGLRKFRMPYAGAGANATSAGAPAVFTRKGTRIRLFSALAFMTRGALWKCGPATDKAPGIAVINSESQTPEARKAKLRRWLAQGKAENDVTIVALHWGLERKTVPTAFQVRLARDLVDVGADIVWGHHPHVLQGAEQYGDGLILYSMGNLVGPRSGDTAIVEVGFSPEKNRQHVSFIPVKYRSGRLSPGGGANWSRLNDAIQRQFPHPQSRRPGE
ncbi:MAG: CapA family protein [Fimbriimonadaceae bacterium]|nr:CapA family protein [Fimbriimonadaceae bacterium]